MTDIIREFAHINLNAAIDDYNTAAKIYNEHNTEANECKVKEKKAFLNGYISAYQTLSGEVINIFYKNIVDKYPIIIQVATI